ncbi:MAG: ferritin [Firmicutes bacterium]|nr:ferritin [Bacillota bacterium]
MSNKLLDMLNEQVTVEAQSGYNYKAMQIYAAEQDLMGFEAWFDKQVVEELGHSEEIMDFLLSLDYKPSYGKLEKPNDDFKDLLDVVKQALEHEKEVTSKIHAIAKAAREEGDERVISFIQKFVDEQVEEEDTFRTLINQIERANGDFAAIALIEASLAKED